MVTDANPLEKEPEKDFDSRQTVEFRCPDGSADIYLLVCRPDRCRTARDWR